MVVNISGQGQPVFMYFLMEEHNITQEVWLQKKKNNPETDEAFTFNYQYIDNSEDGRSC